MWLHSFISTNSVLWYGCKEVQHLKLSLWWPNDDDHSLFGIHSFCRGNLKDSRQSTFMKKNRTATCTYASTSYQSSDRPLAPTRYHWDSELHLLSVTYLDWGSSKVWQLFDVLTLFSNDGSHCKRWDEQVNRLWLWMSLLGKNMSVDQGDHTHTVKLKTTCSSPATNAQMQTVDLAKAGQFFKATMELIASM